MKRKGYGEEGVTGDSFDIELYKRRVSKEILKLLSHKERKSIITYDRLDVNPSLGSFEKEIALRLKHHQMCSGHIWQKAIGCHTNFIDLGTGHESGCDIMSVDKRIIMEVKNRTSTDNSSSRRRNLEKLATYKKDNPCCQEAVYGYVNLESEEKTQVGFRRVTNYNGVDILELGGDELFKYVFGSQAVEVTDFIINFVRNFYIEQNLLKEKRLIIFEKLKSFDVCAKDILLIYELENMLNGR